MRKQKRFIFGEDVSSSNNDPDQAGVPARRLRARLPVLRRLRLDKAPLNADNFARVSAKPRVSVVMPCHNGLPFLIDAVDSITSQTFEDFELIIVDDASKDGSSEWLETRARQDPRIKVLRADKNQGCAKSLNAGARAAAGEWIARMDADDICLPDRLERQLRFVDANPDVVLVGAQVELMDSAGTSLGFPSLPTAHDDIDRSLLYGGWPIVHPVTMFRRSAFERIGGYVDENIGTLEDHDLFIKLAEVGRVANLADVLLRYRRHVKSVTAKPDDHTHLAKAKLSLDSLRRRNARTLSPLMPLHVNSGLSSSFVGLSLRCWLSQLGARDGMLWLSVLSQYLVWRGTSVPRFVGRQLRSRYLDGEATRL
jgi:glycosyltransferase involved in cell wall biosynthesis